MLFLFDFKTKITPEIAHTLSPSRQPLFATKNELRSLTFDIKTFSENPLLKTLHYKMISDNIGSQEDQNSVQKTLNHTTFLKKFDSTSKQKTLVFL